MKNIYDTRPIVTETAVKLAIREFVGGDRYARDHEYCNMQYYEPMRAACQIALDNHAGFHTPAKELRS